MMVSLEWKVPGWLPDFLSVLVFFAKSIFKALLTVVGRVVHTRMSSFIPQIKNNFVLAHTRELWAVTVLLTDGSLCLMCTAQWVTKTSKCHRTPREVGCNWAPPMQAASWMMLIEDMVLDDSLDVHYCLHYFPPHESFFCCFHLSVTIVSTTNVIPTTTVSDLYMDHGYTCLQMCAQLTVSSLHAQLHCHNMFVIYYTYGRNFSGILIPTQP